MELIALLYMLGIAALSAYALYLAISLTLHFGKSFYNYLRRKQHH